MSVTLSEVPLHFHSARLPSGTPPLGSCPPLVTPSSPSSTAPPGTLTRYKFLVVPPVTPVSYSFASTLFPGLFYSLFWVPRTVGNGPKTRTRLTPPLETLPDTRHVAIIDFILNFVGETDDVTPVYLRSVSVVTLDNPPVTSLGRF